MNLGEKKEETKDDVDLKDCMPSKLDPQVQDFVKLIYNKGLMEQAVAANGYDIKKLPLGDLSSETIQKGYTVLSEIEKAINNKETSKLQELCGKFYTYIPHNFGRQKMENFIIDTEDKLKDKQELIQKLVGINAANDAIKAKQSQTTTGTKPNPIDLNYDRLIAKMSPILANSDEYKMIEKYIQNGGG